MAIQISALQTAYENFKRDIDDVDDDIFVEWCKYIFYFIYEKLSYQDPERFISETVYYSVTDPDTFTLPTDFMDMRRTGCGFYELTSADLAYDAQTANFTLEATLTGGTSGATAIVYSDDDDGATGTLTLKQVSGVFVDNELITDDSGGSATVNGAPVYDINLGVNNDKLGETGFGSKTKGFYFNGSNVVFTGAEGLNFVFRYIPQPLALSAKTQYFTLDGTDTGTILVEDRHLLFLRDAIDVYYAQWDEDLSYESIADFRMVRALGEILSTYMRTPHVISEPDYTQNF